MQINCAYVVRLKWLGDNTRTLIHPHTRTGKTHLTSREEKQFKRQFRPKCKHFVSVVNSSLVTRNSLKSALAQTFLQQFASAFSNSSSLPQRHALVFHTSRQSYLRFCAHCRASLRLGRAQKCASLWARPAK